MYGEYIYRTQTNMNIKKNASTANGLEMINFIRRVKSKNIYFTIVNIPIYEVIYGKESRSLLR